VAKAFDVQAIYCGSRTIGACLMEYHAAGQVPAQKAYWRQAVVAGSAWVSAVTRPRVPS